MTLFLTIIIIVAFLTLIATFALSKRNNKTLRKALMTSVLISELNLKEIKEEKGYNGWRYDLYQTINYNKVVLTFWKPIDSFYDLDWDNEPTQNKKEGVK